MFPLDFPPGTTPRSLFTELLPREHARLVPRDAGQGRASVHLTPGPSFVLTIDGDRVEVEEASAPASGGETEPMSLSVPLATLERFLEDWTGERRYLPKFAPRGGVQLLTDPRILRRLAMVEARIELALTDFEGGRAQMTIGAGARPRGDRATGGADVVIEATTQTFEELLAGTLAPDEAIADGHVAVRGGKLVAMKFALALVPFFPPRG